MGGPIVVERSEERSDERSAERNDKVADRDLGDSRESSNVADTVAETADYVAAGDAGTVLAYIDEQRRMYRCPMCPVGSQERMRRYLPIHMH